MVITKDRPKTSIWSSPTIQLAAIILIGAVIVGATFLPLLWWNKTYRQPFFYVVKQTTEAPCHRDSSEEVMCTWVRHSHRTKNQVTMLCVGGFCEAVAK